MKTADITDILLAQAASALILTLAAVACWHLVRHTFARQPLLRGTFAVMGVLFLLGLLGPIMMIVSLL